MKKKYLVTLACLSFLIAAAPHAQAVLYILDSSDGAVWTAGNPKSDSYYEYDYDTAAETGPASDLYSIILGGDTSNGFWYELSWGLNPQPFLTKVVFKGGGGPNGYVWSGSALTEFNTGVFTSLRVVGDGVELKNPGNGNYRQLSHGGIIAEDRPPSRVPDTGATLALFGLGLAMIGIVRRRTR